MAAGDFDNLRGTGQPLRFDSAEQLAGENWLGFKILKDNDLLPGWLLLAKEIEREELALADLERRHSEWVDLARATAEWERHAPALRNLSAKITEGARALRRKQDRYNVEAPHVALERPGTWVERRLAAMTERLREAGAPEWLLPVPV